MCLRDRIETVHLSDRPIINHAVFKDEDQVKKEKRERETRKRRRTGGGLREKHDHQVASKRERERERERERVCVCNEEKRSEIGSSASRETMIARRFMACVFNDDH